MKRLDMCFEDLDSIREAILALDLDRAIREMADLLQELLDIHSGVDRGEPLESATTFTKPRVPDFDGVQSDTVDRHYLNERYWVI